MTEFHCPGCGRRDGVRKAAENSYTCALCHVSWQMMITPGKKAK